MIVNMSIRENLLLMSLTADYRAMTARNQRSLRHNPKGVTDQFWAERNRMARDIYKKLLVAM